MYDRYISIQIHLFMLLGNVAFLQLTKELGLPVIIHHCVRFPLREMGPWATCEKATCDTRRE